MSKYFKIFCTATEMINTIKRKPTECQKIVVNHITGKELIPKIYKELIQLNSKTTTQIIQFQNRERTKLIEKDIRFAVIRGGNWGEVILDEGGQKAQTSRYKINKY